MCYDSSNCYASIMKFRYLPILASNNNRMKKLLFVFIALMVMGNVSFAQDAKPAKAPRKVTKELKAPENVVKADPALQQQANQAKTKKDGTPDMRYKENKAAKEAKPVGPVKKDGTPDKRYKANKTDATATPVKK